MNKFLSTLSLLALALISVSCNGSDGDVAKVEESLRSVPFNEVTLNDDFWLPRLKIQKVPRQQYIVHTSPNRVYILRQPHGAPVEDDGCGILFSSLSNLPFYF